MKNLKHTPGPWVADLRSGCCAVYPKSREEDTAGCHIDDPRNVHFSSKGSVYDRATGFWSMDEEAQENARLIAAAPEMLESMIKAYRELIGVSRLQDWHSDSFREVIEEMERTIEAATNMKIEEVLEATARQEAER